MIGISLEAINQKIAITLLCPRETRGSLSGAATIITQPAHTVLTKDGRVMATLKAWPMMNDTCFDAILKRGHVLASALELRHVQFIINDDLRLIFSDHSILYSKSTKLKEQNGW